MGKCTPTYFTEFPRLIVRVRNGLAFIHDTRIKTTVPHSKSMTQFMYCFFDESIPKESLQFVVITITIIITFTRIW